MSVAEPSILCILLCGDLVEHRKDLTNKGESKMWDFYEYNTGLFHTKHFSSIWNKKSSQINKNYL